MAMTTRSDFMMTATALAGLVAGSAQAADLTIYTYESFTAEWGPGPAVEAAFEARCGCDISFVSVADGVAILTRLKLEGERTEADIVLGLDTNLTAEARDTGLFAPATGIDTARITVPGGWTDDTFLPFDYGWFAVVADTEQKPEMPTSLKALVDGDPADKIVIQDPRTSTPGLGLLLWVKAVYGDDAPAAWQKLSARILTVTPGWSEAYSLFTSGEAPFVLSYTTSEAYHRIAEGTERYKALAFDEGHYMQVEVAAMTVKGAANPLARQFLDFMLSPAFQDEISQKNWMLPAAPTSAPLDPVFDTLATPQTSLLLDPETVRDNRKAWIDEWLAALAR